MIGGEVLEISGASGEEGFHCLFKQERRPDELEDGQTLEVFQKAGLETRFRRKRVGGSLRMHQYRIRSVLGNGDTVGVETYKDFVSVNLNLKLVDDHQGAAPRTAVMALPGWTAAWTERNLDPRCQLVRSRQASPARRKKAVSFLPRSICHPSPRALHDARLADQRARAASSPRRSQSDGRSRRRSLLLEWRRW